MCGPVRRTSRNGRRTLRSTPENEGPRASFPRDCSNSLGYSRELPRCPPNVGLSCEPREQAERRASDALRSVGVRQIQARVGLRLGPRLTCRSTECPGRCRVLLIPVVVLRCGDPVDRGGPQLGLFRTASCPIERGEREPSAAPAVRRSRGRRRTSRRRPPAESLCVRHFPRFFAHSRPPSGRWYQGGIAGQQACSKK